MSGATVTVIDRKRGGSTPRAFDRPGAGANDPAIREKLDLLSKAAAGRDATGILELALKEAFPGKTAVVSSFGAESVVLLHLVASIDPNTPVLFLNTGKLFGETLRYRDRLQAELGLTDLRAIGPHPDDRKALDPEGTLWSRDPDACCHFRKVVPLRHALEGFSAQITGRKRFQTHSRAAMEPVEYFEGRFRFNPLAEWSLEDLNAYVAAHKLPVHPLVEDGYPSIGCIPCTRRVAAGEGYRDGRWAGLEKDECGIHTGVDGEGI
ncbi:MAG: phosphoadenylyl-sulfate reductase [Alphaproteobacteria bacterium]|nr:phosphoadenylyl-sulfate reductase [Alphaproteobacteria bacterium]MBN9566831.1 phosphoadenylyl-sulfate reductase [Alphaproteobacteria bacterium]MBN9591460.1 phosphoadenylyl-sulfate reductase [Alphaproteobacteria bacterium]